MLFTLLLRAGLVVIKLKFFSLFGKTTASPRAFTTVTKLAEEKSKFVVPFTQSRNLLEIDWLGDIEIK
jgi:hypothetical protein